MYTESLAVLDSDAVTFSVILLENFGGAREFVEETPRAEAGKNRIGLFGLSSSVRGGCNWCNSQRSSVPGRSTRCMHPVACNCCCLWLLRGLIHRRFGVFRLQLRSSRPESVETLR